MITQEDIKMAIRAVVDEREYRRRSYEEPEKGEAVLKMNKVLDVLRFAEHTLPAVLMLRYVDENSSQGPSHPKRQERRRVGYGN